MSKKLPEQELDRGVEENKVSVERENAGNGANENPQQDAAEGNVDAGQGAPHTEGSYTEEEDNQEGVSRSDAPAGFEEEE